MHYYTLSIKNIYNIIIECNYKCKKCEINEFNCTLCINETRNLHD